jgi:putative ABC transport system substrate-binding protein
MGMSMRRREFLGVLGGVAAWPLAARAQQTMAMPRIGFVHAGTAASLRPQLVAFRDGLKEFGLIEGQNVAIEYRFGEGQFDRLRALSDDLVRHRVAVLVAGSHSATMAARQATVTIPIVFTMGDDPIKLGLVTNLARPSGNLTGVYHFLSGLEGKRLGLLHELLPKVGTIAVLLNSSNTTSKFSLQEAQEVAPRLGVQLVIVTANVESDFEAAFATMAREGAGALLVTASPFFLARRQQLVVLAARHGIPAIYEMREYPEAGGLMSYGTNLGEAYRQVGLYVGRILTGAKTTDLPVVQTTKFEFVINLSTAKALGIDVPGTLSARADEVIE